MREFTVYTTERTCSVLPRAVKCFDYREIGTALRGNLLSAYNREVLLRAVKRFRLQRDGHCIEREFTVYTTERTCSILLRAVKGLDYREIGTALRENLLSAYNRGPAQFCSGSLYMHFCRGL